MSEHFKHKEHKENQEVPEQGEPDVIGLLKKIQQHLGFLEKKIDLLTSQSSQSSERPFRGKPFSKPYRPGGGGYFPRRENREHGNPPREGNFSQGDRPFRKPHGDENRGGFGPRKKPFFHRRKDRG